MGEVLIKVENVSKKFSKDLKTSLKYGFSDAFKQITGIKHKTNLRPTEFWAVSDISFEVRRGESIGLLGHNGAGKSTLLKMLNGLIKPDTGRIEMRGKVGALIELGAGFNPVLTGRENIYINAAVLGFSRKEIQAKFDDIVEFAEIGEFIDTPVQNYSSGMKVRLGFAIAAQMEPDVLIIDEVLAVGDTGFKIKCFNRIAELKEKSAVIFVSHSMPQVSRICNKAILMNKGQMKYFGSNMTEAVEKYYSLFNKDQIIAKNEFENITINNIIVTNQRKDKTINHNDDLHMELSIIKKNNSDIHAFGVIIFDQDYKSVASSVCDLNYDSKLKELNFEFIIPNIQLGIGKYYISLQFFKSIGTDNRGAVLDYCQNVSSFVIVNSPMITAASFQLLNKITYK